VVNLKLIDEQRRIKQNVLMELTTNQTNNTKGLAILMMLCLHLFNRNYEGLFQPLIFVGVMPLSYYISLFCDCCVAIYCFCSGYGLYIGYTRAKENYARKNYIRILKLFVNYWIVLLVFAVIFGLIVHKEGYPGNFQKFLLNFLALESTYNGAWWFFRIYIFLVLTSPLIFRMVQKWNPFIIIFLSLVFYSLAYIQRIKEPVIFGSVIPDWLISQLALYGNCFFPFMMGALFIKYKVYPRFYTAVRKVRFYNVFLIVAIVLLVVGHGFVPMLYIAVFTGILFIMFFNALDLPIFLNKPLQFLSQHSTNFWLIHMFFYLIYFPTLIYAPQNPTLIFLWLVLWCLAASYTINFLYKPLLKSIDAKLN